MIKRPLKDIINRLSDTTFLQKLILQLKSFITRHVDFNKWARIGVKYIIHSTISTNMVRVDVDFVSQNTSM